MARTGAALDVDMAAVETHNLFYEAERNQKRGKEVGQILQCADLYSRSTRTLAG